MGWLRRFLSLLLVTHLGHIENGRGRFSFRAERTESVAVSPLESDVIPIGCMKPCVGSLCDCVGNFPYCAWLTMDKNATQHQPLLSPWCHPLTPDKLTSLAIAFPRTRSVCKWVRERDCFTVRGLQYIWHPWSSLGWGILDWWTGEKPVRMFHWFTGEIPFQIY